jgi:hypothetical protein
VVLAVGDGVDDALFFSETPDVIVVDGVLSAGLVLSASVLNGANSATRSGSSSMTHPK